jgi:hypothetical protein
MSNQNGLPWASPGRASSIAPALLIVVAGCASAAPMSTSEAPLGAVPPPAVPPPAAPVVAELPPAEPEAALADASSDMVPATNASDVAAPATPAVPRAHAPFSLVTIHEKPDRDAPVLGAMHAGQSVVITDTSLDWHRQQKRLYQCDTGWYPVAPRGFVCVGGAAGATLDGNDPRVVAARATLPDLDSVYPFKYGVSVGAPQYLRIPTADEQRRVEPGLDAHLASLPAADDEKGGAIDARTAGRGPSDDLLRYIDAAKPALTAAQDVYDGYKLAWTQEFDANGRTWLLTPDLTLVPKDKVRQKPLPMLTGIDLGKNPDVELPLAFLWLEDSPKFRKGDDGKLVPTGEVFKRHSFVPATLEQVKHDHTIYWQMRDGSFVKYQDVSMIRQVPRRPAGIGPQDKWVDVRVTWGYLVAYEGDRPVYATAMSPGADGILEAKHATARGKQHVDWKLYSGDMNGRDKGKDWFVEEVPWVQYYRDNYALHGAWWHDDFGRPKSHGCINLSPPDARHLFGWMDPQIPEGWYAVSAYYPHFTGTMLLIRP